MDIKDKEWIIIMGEYFFGQGQIVEKKFSGIRQWPINVGISSMRIHKITPSVGLNFWLKLLETQLI